MVTVMKPRTVTAREIILSKALREIVKQEHKDWCPWLHTLDSNCECHVAIAEKALEDAK